MKRNLNRGMIEYAILFFVIIGFIGFFALRFGGGGEGTDPLFNPKYLSIDYLFLNLVEILKSIWYFLTEGPLGSIFKSILAVLSIVLIAIIAYITVRLRELDNKQIKKAEQNIPKNLVNERVNPIWEKIKEHVSSDNPANWRMAIIEADLLLEEVVTEMGYQGVSLGEKLKAIEPSDFPTLQLAWEAHKTRNKIAHEGERFVLTQREARRIIGLFEVVLKDTGYFAR